MTKFAVAGLHSVVARTVPPNVAMERAARRERNQQFRLRILMLCDYHVRSASTIVEHIEALQRHTRHQIDILPARGIRLSMLDLAAYDGVFIHYSLIACHDGYVAPETRLALRRFRGLKAIFIQDDYRFINDTVAATAAMQVHLLFGLAPPDIIDEVYLPERLLGVRRETLLAGYVPESWNSRPVPPYSERPIDIGYRARRLPAWLGSHGQEKWIIGHRVLEDAPRYGLRCDISWRESDRLYGERWIEFIARCKATIGSESGSGVCDFGGEIQRAVEAHEAREPSVTFDTLRELYFKHEDGRLMMNVISPRCFEAASLRTLMILYEGHYSGRLLPWQHYVPLRKDHSNMDEVVAVLRDPARAGPIIDRAYRDVARNPENTFRAMVAYVDRVVDETFDVSMAATQSTKAPLKQVTGDLKRGRRPQLLLQHIVPAGSRLLHTALSLAPPRLRWRLRGAVRTAATLVFPGMLIAMNEPNTWISRYSATFLPRLAAVAVVGLLRYIGVRGLWSELKKITALRYWITRLPQLGCRVVIDRRAGCVVLEGVEHVDADAARLDCLARGELTALFRCGQAIAVSWEPRGIAGFARHWAFSRPFAFRALSRIAQAAPGLVANVLCGLAPRNRLILVVADRRDPAGG